MPESTIPTGKNKIIENNNALLDHIWISILHELAKIAALVTAIIIILKTLNRHYDQSRICVDYLELIILVGAFLIMICLVILQSLENRWKANTRSKVLELSTAREKLELEYSYKLKEIQESVQNQANIK